MDTATASGTVMISLEDTYAGLARSLEDCLQAVVAARPAQRSSLPALRLAVRCLGCLMRLVRLQPSFLAATVAHVNCVLAATNTEFQAAQAGQHASLGFLAVRITCQTYLTRLAEQQLRANKRAEAQQRQLPVGTKPARSPVAPSVPRPLATPIIVGDLATTLLAKLPPAVAAPGHAPTGTTPQHSAAPLTQRAKWLAGQEGKRAKRAG